MPNHKAEQRENTEASQRKRAANQEAGDKAEQGKNTEAGQRKRAEIREGRINGNSALGLSPPYVAFVRPSVTLLFGF